MKTVAIIQARMGSTRLPGKVLKNILGKPMLIHIVERLRTVTQIDDVVVATSIEKINNSIRDECKKNNITCFSGSEDDVLDRFYQAAKQNNAEIILRITGDCPLIDSKIISRLIDNFLDTDYEFMGLATGAGVISKEFDGHRFPDGLDTEIFYFSLLEIASKEATQKFEREHVTPFIWKKPERFKIGSFKSDKDYSKMRWVVDNQEDFEVIEEIYKDLYPINQNFGLDDILGFFKKHHDLLKKNMHFIGQEGYEEFWKDE